MRILRRRSAGEHGPGLMVRPAVRDVTKAILLSALLALLLVLGGFFLVREQESAVPRAFASMPSERFVKETGTAGRKELLAAVKDREAIVVWSSNRSGNHDIFLLALPDFELVRLTEHPHVDCFPRISPDGTEIVFARSQAPNVSQRNKIAWDVHVFDLLSGRGTLVARDGNTPTWSADGRKIFFLRNAVEFVELNLDTGEESVLFRSGEGQIPSDVTLSYPDFNTEERELAVTLRGGQRMTAILGSGGTFVRVGGGCTLSWAPDRSYLYLVSGYGGRQKNAFHKYDRQTRQSNPWLDLPGDLSHEYFPRVSNDGQYLVFGASAGGHELDIADYEIFLWKIGTPQEDAVRVTFNSANDCWPDMYVQPAPAGRGETS